MTHDALDVNELADAVVEAMKAAVAPLRAIIDNQAVEIVTLRGRLSVVEAHVTDLESATQARR